MNEHVRRRIVRVFRNGRSRAVRIPKEFDFNGDEGEMVKDENGSITMVPVRKSSLSEYLKTAEPWTGEDFVIDDSDLPPLDEPDF